MQMSVKRNVQENEQLGEDSRDSRRGIFKFGGDIRVQDAAFSRYKMPSNKKIGIERNWRVSASGISDNDIITLR